MSKRILIIDDEALVTTSLCRLLDAEDYQVTVVHSGEEALRVIQGADFDLVVSDVRMPGIDGVQTLKQIRGRLQSLKRALPPEILITGYADVSSYERALKLGVQEYLYKPFDNIDFLRVVRNAIG